MSSHDITECLVEAAAIAWLESLGYAVLYGPNIAAGEPGVERADLRCRDVMPKTFISGELRVKDAKRQMEEPTA